LALVPPGSLRGR